MAEHGGKRKGAGRKTKADEQKLIERLDSIIEQDDVIEKLKEMVKDGNFQAVKLYLEYRYGKPKESVDVTTNGDDIGFSKITFLNGNKDK
jgi:hypothetical protein